MIHTIQRRRHCKRSLSASNQRRVLCCDNVYGVMERNIEYLRDLQTVASSPLYLTRQRVDACRESIRQYCANLYDALSWCERYAQHLYIRYRHIKSRLSRGGYALLLQFVESYRPFHNIVFTYLLTLQKLRRKVQFSNSLQLQSAYDKVRKFVKRWRMFPINTCMLGRLAEASSRIDSIKDFESVVAHQSYVIGVTLTDVVTLGSHMLNVRVITH